MLFFMRRPRPVHDALLKRRLVAADEIVDTAIKVDNRAIKRLGFYRDVNSAALEAMAADTLSYSVRLELDATDALLSIVPFDEARALILNAVGTYATLYFFEQAELQSTSLVAISANFRRGSAVYHEQGQDAGVFTRTSESMDFFVGNYGELASAEIV